MASFYLDNDVSLHALTYLWQDGHDARAASDLSAERLADDEQLLLAAGNGWVFVTHNRRDFSLLHGARRRWSRAWRVEQDHAGILVVPQGSRFGLEWSPEIIAREVGFQAGTLILTNRLLVRLESWVEWDEGNWHAVAVRVQTP